MNNQTAILTTIVTLTAEASAWDTEPATVHAIDNANPTLSRTEVKAAIAGLLAEGRIRENGRHLALNYVATQAAARAS